MNQVTTKLQLQNCEHVYRGYREDLFDLMRIDCLNLVVTMLTTKERNDRIC